MAKEITAELVMALRHATGIGIGKCKEALQESDGDIELAVKNLRKAGLASAVKKEGRETKEGACIIAENDQLLAVIEANAETDFVVSNKLFQEFGKNVAEAALKKRPKSVDELLATPCLHDPSMTVDNYRAITIQTLGENIQIKRLALFDKGTTHSVASYSHMGGKIVVVVELTGSSGEESLARDIAMHIAAESPEYVDIKDVPEEIKKREAEIAESQVKGRPANMIEKIVEGKVRAYYDQVCLLRQKYIRNSELTVTALLEKRSKEIGKPLTVERFIRWTVGEQS